MGLADDGMGGDASLVGQAADEIERLRGRLENVQRDRMTQVEVERLRALITEWADADRAFNQSDSPHAAKRYIEAMGALREEAGR
jgi:hypothetical protein